VVKGDMIILTIQTPLRLDEVDLDVDGLVVFRAV
jgi:hypothetical protein